VCVCGGLRGVGTVAVSLSKGHKDMFPLEPFGPGHHLVKNVEERHLTFSEMHPRSLWVGSTANTIFVILAWQIWICIKHNSSDLVFTSVAILSPCTT